jgi:hypothetical protein
MWGKIERSATVAGERWGMHKMNEGESSASVSFQSSSFIRCYY